MPRVRYVGAGKYDGTDEDMHVFEDEHGNSYAVPNSLFANGAPPELPQTYQRELGAGFDRVRDNPAALEHLRERYNEQAFHSRYNNPAENMQDPAPQGSPLVEWHNPIGYTRTRLPHSPSFDTLPDNWVESGENQVELEQPREPQPKLHIAVGTEGPTDRLDHERLHAAAVQTDDSNTAGMNPREREEYRVYKTMRNQADPHLPHNIQRYEQAEPETKKRLDDAVSGLRRKLGLL